jgi:hypothetical protein
MYIVELRPGKEELYRTVDELTAAIRRGDVTWQSRIYHQAALRWISITLHPHFRKIAGERRADPPQRLPRAEWTFLRAEAPPERLTSELARQKAQRVGRSSRASGTVSESKTNRSWRRVLFGGLIGQSQA